MNRHIVVVRVRPFKWNTHQPPFDGKALIVDNDDGYDAIDISPIASSIQLGRPADRTTINPSPSCLISPRRRAPLG